MINKLAANFRVVRWEGCLRNPLYLKNRALLDEQYAVDKNLYAAFNRSALEYLRRQGYSPDTSRLASDFRYQKCIEYLKEECAVIMPMWAEMGINFVIYPNEMLDAMQAAYQALVKPFYSAYTVYWLSLRFKRLTVPMSEARSNVEAALLY